MRSESFAGARGHVAWILALAFSTAAIIHLERTDIASLSDRAQLVNPELVQNARDLLELTTVRYTAAAKDPQAATDLLLALVAAAQAGAIELHKARKQAASIVVPAGTTDPDLLAAQILAALTFGR